MAQDKGVLEMDDYAVFHFTMIMRYIKIME